MKFVEGIAVGALITAGVMMACSEPIDENKKKFIKKGKQFIKKVMP